MKTDANHTPRQERSRATAEKLLNATIALLDEAGLDGALIPRIAEAAGVAPASVYRRFADKNALLRAAFLHALTQSNQDNRAQLSEMLLGPSLADTAARLVALMFEQYRRHPRFLRALSLFVDTDTDARFVGQARAILRANIDLVVEVLLVHSKDIAHPDPAAALRFLVLHIGCAIETFALEPHSMWHAAPALSAEELAGQLVHTFLAHLGTAPEKPVRLRARLPAVE
jgi:AcrR family transcriptional regulator